MVEGLAIVSTALVPTISNWMILTTSGFSIGSASSLSVHRRFSSNAGSAAATAGRCWAASVSTRRPVAVEVHAHPLAGELEHGPCFCSTSAVLSVLRKDRPPPLISVCGLYFSSWLIHPWLYRQEERCPAWGGPWVFPAWTLRQSLV